MASVTRSDQFRLNRSEPVPAQIIDMDKKRCKKEDLLVKTYASDCPIVWGMENNYLKFRCRIWYRSCIKQLGEQHSVMQLGCEIRAGSQVFK